MELYETALIEIGLEGLNGATQDRLIKLIKDKLNVNISKNSHLFHTLLWNLLQSQKIDFFEIEDNCDMEQPDIIELFPVKGMDIRGSCKCYNSLKNITGILNKLSFIQSVDHFHNHKNIIMIANQTVRNNILFGSCFTEYNIINDEAYCLLELIGKMRQNGFSSNGTMLTKQINIAAKTLFYYINKILLKYNLISIQEDVSRSKHNKAYKFLYLKQFKKYGKHVNITGIIEYLNSCPAQTATYRELELRWGKRARNKIKKLPFVQVTKVDGYVHSLTLNKNFKSVEQIDKEIKNYFNKGLMSDSSEDSDDSFYNNKNESTKENSFVVGESLLSSTNTISDIVPSRTNPSFNASPSINSSQIKATSALNDDSQDSAEDNDDPKVNQFGPFEPSHRYLRQRHNPLVTQVYNFILQEYTSNNTVRGVTRQTILQRVGISEDILMRIIKFLLNKELIDTYYHLKGQCRCIYYIPKNFDKISGNQNTLICTPAPSKSPVKKELTPQSAEDDENNVCIKSLTLKEELDSKETLNVTDNNLNDHAKNIFRFEELIKSIPDNEAALNTFRSECPKLTTNNLQRYLYIVDYLRKNKLCLAKYVLRQHVIDEEEKHGSNHMIDRKSFYRLLHALSKSYKLIRLYQMMIPPDSKLEMICDARLSHNDPLINETLNCFKAGLLPSLRQMKEKPSGRPDKLANTGIEVNCGIDSLNFTKRRFEPLPPSQIKIIPPDQQSYTPKMIKNLFAHQYLLYLNNFILKYGTPSPTLDSSQSHLADDSANTISDELLKSPEYQRDILAHLTVYSKGKMDNDQTKKEAETLGQDHIPDWIRYIPYERRKTEKELLSHKGVYLQDLLSHMPLSIATLVWNVSLEIELLNEFLSDECKKHIPIMFLPYEMQRQIYHANSYRMAIRSRLMDLVVMGLCEIDASSRIINTYIIKPSLCATVLDTLTSMPGSYTITAPIDYIVPNSSSTNTTPDSKAALLSYFPKLHFDFMAHDKQIETLFTTLDQYWTTIKRIALFTPIKSRSSNLKTNLHNVIMKDYLFKPRDNLYCQNDPDHCSLPPGDHLGVGGFDSFSHFRSDLSWGYNCDALARPLLSRRISMSYKTLIPPNSKFNFDDGNGVIHQKAFKSPLPLTTIDILDEGFTQLVKRIRMTEYDKVRDDQDIHCLNKPDFPTSVENLMNVNILRLQKARDAKILKTLKYPILNSVDGSELSQKFKTPSKFTFSHLDDFYGMFNQLGLVSHAISYLLQLYRGAKFTKMNAIFMYMNIFAKQFSPIPPEQLEQPQLDLLFKLIAEFNDKKDDPTTTTKQSSFQKCHEFKSLNHKFCHAARSNKWTAPRHNTDILSILADPVKCQPYFVQNINLNFTFYVGILQKTFNMSALTRQFGEFNEATGNHLVYFILNTLLWQLFGLSLPLHLLKVDEALFQFWHQKFLMKETAEVVQTIQKVSEEHGNKGGKQLKPFKKARLDMEELPFITFKMNNEPSTLEERKIKFNTTEKVISKVLLWSEMENLARKSCWNRNSRQNCPIVSLDIYICNILWLEVQREIIQKNKNNNINTINSNNNNANKAQMIDFDENGSSYKYLYNPLSAFRPLEFNKYSLKGLIKTACSRLGITTLSVDSTYTRAEEALIENIWRHINDNLPEDYIAPNLKNASVLNKPKPVAHYLRLFSSIPFYQNPSYNSENVLPVSLDAFSTISYADCNKTLLNDTQPPKPTNVSLEALFYHNNARLGLKSLLQYCFEIERSSLFNPLLQKSNQCYLDSVFRNIFSTKKLIKSIPNKPYDFIISRVFCKINYVTEDISIFLDQFLHHTISYSFELAMNNPETAYQSENLFKNTSFTQDNIDLAKGIDNNNPNDDNKNTIQNPRIPHCDYVKIGKRIRRLCALEGVSKNSNLNQYAEEMFLPAFNLTLIPPTQNAFNANNDNIVIQTTKSDHHSFSLPSFFETVELLKPLLGLVTLTTLSQDNHESFDIAQTIDGQTVNYEILRKLYACVERAGNKGISEYSLSAHKEFQNQSDLKFAFGKLITSGHIYMLGLGHVCFVSLKHLKAWSIDVYAQIISPNFHPKNTELNAIFTQQQSSTEIDDSPINLENTSKTHTITIKSIQKYISVPWLDYQCLLPPLLWITSPQNTSKTSDLNLQQKPGSCSEETNNDSNNNNDDNDKTNAKNDYSRLINTPYMQYGPTLKPQTFDFKLLEHFVGHVFKRIYQAPAVSYARLKTLLCTDMLTEARLRLLLSFLYKLRLITITRFIHPEMRSNPTFDNNIYNTNNHKAPPFLFDNRRKKLEIITTSYKETKNSLEDLDPLLFPHPTDSFKVSHPTISPITLKQFFLTVQLQLHFCKK